MSSFLRPKNSRDAMRVAALLNSTAANQSLFIDKQLSSRTGENLLTKADERRAELIGEAVSSIAKQASDVEDQYVPFARKTHAIKAPPPQAPQPPPLPLPPTEQQLRIAGAASNLRRGSPSPTPLPSAKVSPIPSVAPTPHGRFNQAPITGAPAGLQGQQAVAQAQAQAPPSPPSPGSIQRISSPTSDDYTTPTGSRSATPKTIESVAQTITENIKPNDAAFAKAFSEAADGTSQFLAGAAAKYGAPFANALGSLAVATAKGALTLGYAGAKAGAQGTLEAARYVAAQSQYALIEAYENYEKAKTKEGKEAAEKAIQSMLTAQHQPVISLIKNRKEGRALSREGSPVVFAGMTQSQLDHAGLDKGKGKGKAKDVAEPDKGKAVSFAPEPAPVEDNPVDDSVDDGVPDNFTYNGIITNYNQQSALKALGEGKDLESLYNKGFIDKAQVVHDGKDLYTIGDVSYDNGKISKASKGAFITLTATNIDFNPFDGRKRERYAFRKFKTDPNYYIAEAKRKFGIQQEGSGLRPTVMDSRLPLGSGLISLPDLEKGHLVAHHKDTGELLVKSPISEGLKYLITHRGARKSQATKKYTLDDIKRFLDLSHALEKKITSKSSYKKMAQADQSVFYYKNPEDLWKRLEVLSGAVEAGNTNPVLKKQGLNALNILLKDRHITKKDYEELCQSLIG
jgi:hypothetical protein